MALPLYSALLPVFGKKDVKRLNKTRVDLAPSLSGASILIARNKRKQTELTEPSFSSSPLTPPRAAAPPVFLTANKHASNGPAPPHDLLCSSPYPPGLQLLRHGEEGRIHRRVPPLPTTSSAPPHLLVDPAVASRSGGPRS